MMVMDFDAKRLLLVLQVDHSHVAGFLGAHWGNRRFREARAVHLGNIGRTRTRWRLGGLGNEAIHS